ncbi:MAG: flagellar biosynthesis protein FlhF [Bacteroidota bacterium]
MRIKRYVARTIQEALDTVREDLGPDAVILHTRKARRGRLAGLLGGERFEVIAALDVNVPEPGKAAPAGSGSGTGSGSGSGAGVGRSTGASPRITGVRAGGGGAARPGGGSAGLTGQGRQATPSRPAGRYGPPGATSAAASAASVAAAATSAGSAGSTGSAGLAGSAVSAVSAGPASRQGLDTTAGWLQPARGARRAYETAPAARLVEMHERLLDMDVDPDLAEALIQAAKMKWREAQVAGKSAYELVLDLVTAMLPVAGGVALVPGSRKVAALVGPTGVGKTTTLAKIAALAALFGKKKVAFVTADTYRIAAVEQLRTYAEIIGVPCEVVYTPAEMRAAVASHEERDLVLIDTAGRSPRSGMHMAELRAFLEAAQVDETHLVLSMTTRPRDLLDIVERFSPCGVNRLIFSKLDETSRLGAIVGVTSAVKVPISYVTYGQNVPEDIEVADAAQLARWILDGGVGDAGAGGSDAGDNGTGGAGADGPPSADKLGQTGGR